MTDRVHLPEELRQEILDHCLSTLPNEGCGMLAMDGHRVVKVYPTANDDESPVSYTIPPQEHYEAVVDAESRGWEIRGAFHSHPSGPARMSGTDLDRALRPNWVYVVLGLGAGPGMAIWSDGSESQLTLPGTS